MRSCIIETTRENRPIIEAHLPAGVKVATVNEPFDRFTIELRLEGDGLPPWAVNSDFGYYTRAVAWIQADGSMRLVFGNGLPTEQIHPDVKA